MQTKSLYSRKVHTRKVYGVAADCGLGACWGALHADGTGVDGCMSTTNENYSGVRVRVSGVKMRARLLLSRKLIPLKR